MKKSLLFVFLFAFFVSCVERFEVPLRSETSTLVVEGGITTNKGPYQVKLTYSGIFEYASRTATDQIEARATLTVSDDAGGSTAFKYLGNGIYQTTNPNFRGITGRTYTLKIDLPDGRKFQSNPEKMPSAVPIKEIYGEFRKRENPRIDYEIVPEFSLVIPPRYPGGNMRYLAEPEGSGGYQIFVDTQDPGNEGNYYRWTARSVARRETTGVCCCFTCGCVCGETCFVPQEHLNVNLFSDQLTNGNVIRRRPITLAPVFTSGVVYIEVGQYSYTREAFQFWKRYEEQLTRTGSIIDPLPSPIEGNIYNVNKPTELALGYFSAAGLFRKRHAIEVQLLDLEKFPVLGLNRRRGVCKDIFIELGYNALDSGEWPTPNWKTEELN